MTGHLSVTCRMDGCWQCCMLVQCASRQESRIRGTAISGVSFRWPAIRRNANQSDITGRRGNCHPMRCVTRLCEEASPRCPGNATHVMPAQLVVLLCDCKSCLLTVQAHQNAKPQHHRSMRIVSVHLLTNHTSSFKTGS